MSENDTIDLPPSSRFVYHVLTSNSPTRFTASELQSRTELPESTVYQALQVLVNRDLVEVSPYPKPTRYHAFSEFRKTNES